MLGKLIKYELKATSRTFFLMYAGILILAVINRIFYSIQIGSYSDIFINENVSHFSPTGGTVLSTLTGIFTSLYFLLAFSMFIVVIVIVLQRFYKNLFGDEGYLMLTLPVRSWELIISKAITAAIWYFACTAVIILSLGILLSDSFILSVISEAFYEIQYELAELSGIIVPVIVKIFAVYVFAAIGNALPLFACISIGQTWKKHRVLGAFLAYFGLNTVMQIVSSTIFAVVGQMPAFQEFFYLETAESFVRFFDITLIFSVFITLVLYVISFFITKHIIENKIDLE